MTELVGVLNLTPDSFSDGGTCTDAASMQAAVNGMIVAGASVIDVGAESTRPGAVAIDAEEEWVRLRAFAETALPVCIANGVVVSIDTRHAQTAAIMLLRGAAWVNDVTGFADPAMVAAVRGHTCSLVVMHSLSVPADPAVTLPQDEDVISQLLAFGQERIDQLAQQGIARERIIFDPGIGFGKTAEQSWETVRRIAELKALGVRLLVGHSRKSFLKNIADVPAEGRDAATLAVSSYLALQQVDYLRVHAVQLHSVLLATLQEMQPCA